MLIYTVRNFQLNQKFYKIWKYRTSELSDLYIAFYLSLKLLMLWYIIGVVFDYNMLKLPRM